MKALSPIGDSQWPGHEKAAISALISRLRARRRSRLRALMKYLGGEEYASFKRESPSDWIKVNDPYRPYEPYKPYSGLSQEFPEEEHGQAA